MSDQQITLKTVLNRLTTLRNSMSAEEQVVLDQIVLRQPADDEVVAHSITHQITHGGLQITHNIATGEYEQMSR